MRADFVVEIARDFRAFLVLNCQQLGFERAVARVDLGKPLGHGVKASLKTMEFCRALLPHAFAIAARAN